MPRVPACPAEPVWPEGLLPKWRCPEVVCVEPQAVFLWGCTPGDPDRPWASERRPGPLARLHKAPMCLPRLKRSQDPTPEPGDAAEASANSDGVRSALPTCGTICPSAGSS